MRSEKEIRILYNDWVKVRNELLECGDTVSLIVAEQALSYISTLSFVLEIDEYIVKGVIHGKS